MFGSRAWGRVRVGAPCVGAGTGVAAGAVARVVDALNEIAGLDEAVGGTDVGGEFTVSPGPLARRGRLDDRGFEGREHRSIRAKSPNPA